MVPGVKLSFYIHLESNIDLITQAVNMIRPRVYWLIKVQHFFNDSIKSADSNNWKSTKPPGQSDLEMKQCVGIHLLAKR